MRLGIGSSLPSNNDPSCSSRTRSTSPWRRSRSAWSCLSAVDPQADIDLHPGTVREVDPDRQRCLEDGSLPLRHSGHRHRRGHALEEVSGLTEYAATIWTPETMLDLAAASVRRAGGCRSDQQVLFLVPPNNKCSGPLYEIVFMLETWLREEHPRARRHHLVDLRALVHPGVRPAAARRRRRRVRERGIDGHTGEVAEVAAGEVRYADGVTRAFDELISFPPYVAACRYDGLPADDRGFLETDLEPPGHRAAGDLRARRRRGLPRQAGVPRLPPGRRRSPSTSPPTSKRRRVPRVLRPGEHVHHGDVRQGDLRPGPSRDDRRCRPTRCVRRTPTATTASASPVWRPARKVPGWYPAPLPRRRSLPLRREGLASRRTSPEGNGRRPRRPIQGTQPEGGRPNGPATNHATVGFAPFLLVLDLDAVEHSDAIDVQRRGIGARGSERSVLSSRAAEDRGKLDADPPPWERGSRSRRMRPWR